MSFSPVFCLFRGIKLPAETDIRDNLEAFFDARPELFKDYEPYTKDRPLTFEDVYDEWHDRDYLIDSEFLDGVLLGKALWSASDGDGEIHELQPDEYPNPTLDEWEELPEEVREFIFKYYDEIVKVYTVLYYI